MINISSEIRITGEKIYEAAKLLMDYLGGGEKPTIGAQTVAAEHGISKKTFDRARSFLGIKARRSNGRWFVYAPEGARERFESSARPRKAEFSPNKLSKIIGAGAVSSDWVAVVPEGNQMNGGLRVKVGPYEFEADEGFPTEKLLAVLRALGSQEQATGERCGQEAGEARF